MCDGIVVVAFGECVLFTALIMDYVRGCFRVAANTTVIPDEPFVPHPIMHRAFDGIAALPADGPTEPDDIGDVFFVILLVASSFLAYQNWRRWRISTERRWSIIESRSRKSDKRFKELNRRYRELTAHASQAPARTEPSNVVQTTSTTVNVQAPPARKPPPPPPPPPSKKVDPLMEELLKRVARVE